MKSLFILLALLIPAQIFAATGSYVRNDYTVTPVTTGAYVIVIASLSISTTHFSIYDTSGQDMELKCGSTVVAFPPGGGDIPLNCSQGAAVSLKAITANAVAGENLMSYFN